MYTYPHIHMCVVSSKLTFAFLMQLIPHLFSVQGFFFHLKPNKTQTINLESPVYIPKNYPVKDDNEVLLL